VAFIASRNVQLDLLLAYFALLRAPRHLLMRSSAAQPLEEASQMYALKMPPAGAQLEMLSRYLHQANSALVSCGGLSGVEIGQTLFVED